MSEVCCQPTEQSMRRSALLLLPEHTALWEPFLWSQIFFLWFSSLREAHSINWDSAMSGYTLGWLARLCVFVCPWWYLFHVFRCSRTVSGIRSSSFEVFLQCLSLAPAGQSLWLHYFCKLYKYKHKSDQFFHTPDQMSDMFSLFLFLFTGGKRGFHQVNKQLFFYYLGFLICIKCKYTV